MTDELVLLTSLNMLTAVCLPILNTATYIINIYVLTGFLVDALLCVKSRQLFFSFSPSVCIFRTFQGKQARNPRLSRGTNIKFVFILIFNYFMASFVVKAARVVVTRGGLN